MTFSFFVFPQQRTSNKRRWRSLISPRLPSLQHLVPQILLPTFWAIIPFLNELGFNFDIKWPPWTFYVVPFHVVLNVLLIMLLGNVHPVWYKLYVVFICVMFQIKLL